VAVFHSTTEDCAFVADPGTNDISAIDSNLQAVGRFHGGPLDMNNFAGTALAINRGFLYAPSPARLTVHKVAGWGASEF